MDTVTEPKALTCVLRTLNLCDGQRVIDYRGAHRETVYCYSALLAAPELEELTAASAALRMDRAITVARAGDLLARVERHRRLTAEPERPF